MDSAFTISATDGAPLGYRVSCKEEKRALVITMLHGLASNMTRWSEFSRNTSLIQYNDLLAIDLRGRGTSPFRDHYNRDTWVEDVATILKHEGYEKTILMGHSMGAQVALEYALRYPKQAAGLILIDPVFPLALSGKLAIASRLRGVIWFCIRLVWLLNKLGLKHRHIPTRDLYQLDQVTRERLHNHHDLSIASLYANPFDDAKYLPLANYLRDLYEVTRPLADFSAIEIPVLVLLSKGAALINQERDEKQIARLHHAETIIIEANHWLLTEKPDESRLAIETWYLKHFRGFVN